MVNKFNLATIALLLATSSNVCAENYENISVESSAKACDTRSDKDSIKTVENRAVDKACMSAVKLSGILQEHAPDLSDHAYDLISYRIIDEFMPQKKHEVKLNDGSRVCVEVQTTIEMTGKEMNNLIKEYKNSAPIGVSQVEEVTEKIIKSTSFKPQNLDEKKLIYIEPLIFWNDSTTEHYSEYLSDLFADSDYFYITENKSVADYIITPRVSDAEVDEVDSNNHKMKMIIELQTSAANDKNFAPLNELQSHFILFAVDKDEQEIADTMIRKLLSRAAQNTIAQLKKSIETNLEKEKLRK